MPLTVTLRVLIATEDGTVLNTFYARPLTSLTEVQFSDFVREAVSARCETADEISEFEEE